jgi:cystathionine beta-lyase/cystathionine gamma-synthase
MTHAPVNDAALEVAGISQNLIRLSVGLEGSEDLVADVLAGLEAARRATSLQRVAVIG